jgi:hypothetical protein
MAYSIDQEYVVGQDNDDAGTGVGKLRTGTNNNTILGQSFTPSATISMNKIRLYLKKVGTPTGNLTVEIRADGADPTVAALQATSNTFNVATLISGTYDWWDFTFPTPPTLTGGTEYWILLSGDYSVSSSNAAVWGIDTTSPTYSGGHYGRFGNGSAVWEDITSYDALFMEFNATPLPFNGNDKTSNANNLQTNRGVVASASVPGSLTGAYQSIEFDSAAGDELWLDDTASLSITGNITVEMWIYTSNSAGDCGILKDNIAQNQRQWDFYLDGSENFTFLISTDGSSSSFKTQASGISFDTWTHIAVSYVAATGTVQFFLNGSQVGVDQSGLATSIFDGTARCNLFSTRATTRFCDVRVWNTARSQAQIAANMNTFLVGNESGLVANWQFLQAAGAGADSNAMTGFM